MIRLENKMLLSWDDVVNVTDKIAEQINNLDKKPLYLYGIPRGGLIPATLLSHKTGIKYQQILSVYSNSSLKDFSDVLIVDDICDSGKTLESILKTYPKCQTASLYYKEKASIKPNIYGELVGDEWIVFPWELHDAPTARDKTEF